MLNLAVLYGSKACEHDVSIITALQAMDNLDASKYNIIPVYLAVDGRWFTGDALRDIRIYRQFDERRVTPCRLFPAGEGKGVLERWPHRTGLFAGSPVISQVDCCLLAFHGMNGEDGTVQGMLELYDIPYTSAGLLGSAAGMDKIAMKLLYKGAGFPVLDMVWFLREDFEKDRQAQIDKVEQAFGYPCFVKPANLGSSIGISKATDRDSLIHAIEVAAEFDKRILVEKGVEHVKEVNCAALGYGSDVRPSVCEMPVSWDEFLSFDDKYLRGGKNAKGAKTGGVKSAPAKGPAKGGMASLGRQIPAPISDEDTKAIQDITVEMFKMMDLKGVVRVDFIIDEDDGRIYLNEVNTIPGSLAFYLWEPLGIPYTKLLDTMVENAFKAWEDKNRSAFSYQSNLLQQVGGVGAKR